MEALTVAEGAYLGIGGYLLLIGLILIVVAGILKIGNNILGDRNINTKTDEADEADEFDIVTNKQKKEYVYWLSMRIGQLQAEYDGIEAYDNTPEFQTKLIKGGKLKAYKEIRDYIIKH